MSWLSHLSAWISPRRKAVGVTVTVPLPAMSPATGDTPMSITAIIALLSTLSSLVPEVVKLLETVESAFPNASVDTKIESVVKVLEGLATAENGLSPVIGILGGLIGTLHPANVVAAPKPAQIPQ